MMKSCAAIPRIFAIAVLMALAGFAAAQQAYPNKQVHIIVPYAAGGGLDILARLVAQKLSGNLGQQVIVDNRPGGNTVIGSEALVKSPPDGSTIMLVVNAHAIIPNLVAKLPYDPIKDFAPVASIASSELVLLLNPSVPANNLQELIALAKSKPGQLNYGSAGSGGTSHLASEMLNMMAGIKTQHIPYKGASQALTDLVGGQVQLYFSPPVAAIAHIKSGKIKAIAISGEKRMSTLPQVPTFTQAGLPGFDATLWFGFLAPAGTPKAIIDKLSAEFAKIMAMPELKESLVSQGLEAFYLNPEQFAALIASDIGKFAKIIKTANIKIDN